MAGNTVRGRFVWHELMTPNGAGAHDFYSKVFGWTKQAWEHNPSYSMFAGPKGPLGATVETREGTPQWIHYISTDDVDTTVSAAHALGATVKTPTTAIPNAGTYAVLADPQGAVFAVHSSPTEAQPETPPEPGEFFWHELATNVPAEEAAAFYAQLFGWDVMARHDMGPPMGTYLIFGRNGKQLGGMFNKGDVGRAGSAYWVGYVRVADIDAAVEQVKAGRGGLLTGPMTVPGGDKIAQFSDPHGAFFAAHMQGGALAKPAKPAKPAAAEAAKPAKTAKAAKKKTKAKAKKKAASKKPAKKATKKPTKKAKKMAKKAKKKAKTKAKSKKGKRGTAKKPAKGGKNRRAHGGDAHVR